MKKGFVLLVIVAILLSFASCGKDGDEFNTNIEPEVSQMKTICELAVMECYYHNVAKFFQEDAEKGFLGIGTKDKHFWIEYSGVVKLGLDVSIVSIEVNDTQVVITIPEAKVLGCKVDSASLTTESFIVDKDSAKVTAEDEVMAIAESQKRLEESAANDKTLLANAQQQAMALLEDYVRNIGDAVGIEYSIKWVYVDSEGKQIGTSDSLPETKPTE